MNSEWREVRLGHVCKVRRGSSPRPIKDFLSDAGMPWVKIADATEGCSRFIEKTNGFIKYEGVEKSVVVKPGSLILSNSGTAGLPKFMAIEACIHDGWQVFDEFNGIDVQFLYYELLYIRRKLLHGAYDSIMKNLTLDMVRDTIVSLPDITEQKLIADTLSCLDDKIELNNRINKTLEEMAQAIFKSWFVDFEPFQDGEFQDSELGKIPKGWRIVELGEVAKFVKGKKPTELLGIKTLENEEQYLTIDVLKGGNPQFACVDKMVLSNIYDILMVMDGASSGTIYFGLKGIVASTIAKLEVTNEQLREVVYQYIKVNETEVKTHNTGSAIPHTDKGYVLRCKIAVPDDEILKQISMNLKKTREIITNNSNQNQILTEIRDMLLPKLMNGEIRVPIEEVQVHE